MSTCIKIIKGVIKWVIRIVFVLLFLIVCIVCAFRLIAYLRESKSAYEASPMSGRMIEVNNEELFIQDMGTTSDPAIVFIHGPGAWSETWRGTMEELSSAGFYTVALDLPPFGYSERPEDHIYSRAAQAERILAAMDALKLEKAILVGHSYGGGATIEAVFKASDRFNRLVLVDPVLELQSTSTPNALVKTLLKQRQLRNALLSMTITNSLFTRKLLDTAIENPDALTEELVRMHQQPMSVRHTTKSVGEWLPTFVLKPEDSLSTSIASYENLAIPTLIIWGEKDSIASLSQGEYLAELMPSAELKVLSGVGHIPHLEDPDAFKAALIDFIN